MFGCRESCGWPHTDAGRRSIYGRPNIRIRGGRYNSGAHACRKGSGHNTFGPLFGTGF